MLAGAAVGPHGAELAAAMSGQFHNVASCAQHGARPPPIVPGDYIAETWLTRALSLQQATGRRAAAYHRRRALGARPQLRVGRGRAPHSVLGTQPQPGRPPTLPIAAKPSVCSICLVERKANGGSCMGRSWSEEKGCFFTFPKFQTKVIPMVVSQQ